MATVSRSRVMAVAAALVLFLEGGADAFVLPSGLATQRNLLMPTSFDDDNKNGHKLVWAPLQSFKFIKGETSYGDISEGSSYSGMLGRGSVGFGGSLGGGNSLNRRRRNTNSMWWSRFSQNTPTTLLAVGSLESWPVMEADDIQVLVKKGDDLENELKSAEYGAPKNKHVKATLERWESDIALEVIGRDGYPMLGNQMQPGYNSNNNQNGRCTQSIKFDVANGDLYPFSGTISVPPPLTVEDSMGTKKTVMMVLNNPDDENDQGGYNIQQMQYDEYGNEIPPSKPASVEAKLEPLYKSPDEKYAEAQQRQQLQYDEWGNEVYNPQQEQKTTIPSNGYQSFELDATDPSSGKIKISLEREEGGGGFGGFGGGGNSASEARVEIYHGFKDQYGNPYNNNFGDEEEDKRISLEVSTMHPIFSSVVDTMPANMLAKHSLPSANDLAFVRPYLEVRIVNTGGASLKAGVENFLPQYKPQRRSQQQGEKQKYEQRIYQSRALNSASSVKADDPFLLVDSAQSSTSSRRMKNTSTFGGEKSYVRASSSSSFSGRNGNNPRINEMWSTGSSNNNYNNFYEDQGMARPSQNGYSNSFGSFGMKANNPEDMLNGGSSFFGDTADTYSKNRVMASQRNRPYDSYGNDYYGNGAIDTVATSKFGSSGLIANNDFTKANGSKTSAIVPGSLTSSSGSGSFRRVSPASTGLQSFGGNSGGASGMQQPYQGRSQFGNNNGGSSMFQAQPQTYSGMQDQSQFGNNNMNGQTQFGNNNYGGSTMFQGRSQSIGGSRQRQSFGGDGRGTSMFQGRSQSQSFGNNGMQEQSFANQGSNQRSGGGFQQAFSQLTSPRKTRTVPGQRAAGEQRRYNSAFSGNGNVIGNGVIAGRPATDSTTVGSDNRMMPNNRNLNDGGYSGNNNGFQFIGSNSRNNNERFGNAQSSSFQSSFTPEASSNFGGDPMGGSFGQGNSKSNGFMGSMKQQLQNNDSFSRGNNNRNQQGTGVFENMFGGNNNNQQRNNGRMNNNRFGRNNSNNNSFGGNNSNNNRMNNNGFGGNNNSFGGNNNNGFGGNNNSFGGNNSNSGSPFGNLGTPPQTRGNSKNPFATLNGEATQQQQNNGFSNSNNDSFGSNSFGGGGAPQRPLSPNPSTRKNPFAGLNGNNNNRGPGGSTTAMRSINNNINGDYERKDDNPIANFARNLFGKR